MNLVNRWRFVAGLSLVSVAFTVLIILGHSKDSIRLVVHEDKEEELLIRPTTKVHELSTSPFLSAESINETLMIQQQRQQQMQEACEALKLGKWSERRLKKAITSAGVFYVDDHLRYIYCMVPKASSTTWTRVLLVASEQLSKKDPNAVPQSQARLLRVKGRILRPLGRFSAKEIMFRLKNYFKFMFVRHPLDRLSSAFRDRLKSDHEQAKKMFSQFIMNRYGDSNESKSRRNMDIQFHEFVRFIVDPANKPSDFNFHWRPQFDLCFPCQIKYDFVGHLETLQADAHFVLKQLGPAASQIRFPTYDPDNPNSRHHAAAAAASAGRRKNWTASLATKYLSVSQDDIDRLRTVVYANDMKVFGYE